MQADVINMLTWQDGGEVDAVPHAVVDQDPVADVEPQQYLPEL